MCEDGKDVDGHIGSRGRGVGGSLTSTGMKAPVFFSTIQGLGAVEVQKDSRSRIWQPGTEKKSTLNPELTLISRVYSLGHCEVLGWRDRSAFDCRSLAVLRIFCSLRFGF